MIYDLLDTHSDEKVPRRRNRGKRNDHTALGQASKAMSSKSNKASRSTVLRVSIQLERPSEAFRGVDDDSIMYEFS